MYNIMGDFKKMTDKNADLSEDEKKMYKNFITSGSKHPLVDDSNINMGITRKSYPEKEKKYEKEEIVEVESEIILRFIKCECCDEWKMPEEIFQVETYESILIEEDVNSDEAIIQKELKEEPQMWCINCIQKIRNNLNQKEIDKFHKDFDLAKKESKKIVRVSDEKIKKDKQS
jgi:hypothetical protein